MKKINHTYHMVNNSPWPILTSAVLFNIMFNTIYTINNKNISEINKIYLIILVVMLGIGVYNWFREIIIESTYQGLHTKKVQELMIWGYYLFLLSEILIFATMFFCYFYLSLVPTIELGSIWPPIGIYFLNYKSIPALNTVILYISGICITMVCHKMLSNINNKNKSIDLYFILTLVLGLIFFYFQTIEYKFSYFDISDSVFGSLFFSITGLHGLHGALFNLYIIT